MSRSSATIDLVIFTFAVGMFTSASGLWHLSPSINVEVWHLSPSINVEVLYKTKMRQKVVLLDR